MRWSLSGFGVAIVSAVAVGGGLSATALALPACTDTFTAASGAGWVMASNWTSTANPAVHSVPTSVDVACLNGATVVVSSGAAHAGSVQGGSLSLIGGSLTLSSGSDVSALVNLSLDDSGALTGSTAPVDVTGNFEWGACGSCGNEIAVNATIDQTGGGSFAIDGPGNGLSGPTLTGGAITTTSPVSITNSNFGSTGATTLTTTSTITLGPGLALNGLSPGSTVTAAGIATQPSGNTYGFWGAGLVLTGGTTIVGPNTELAAAAVTVQGGTLNVQNEMIPTPGFALSVTVTGGTLTGTGKINGDLTNAAGMVAVPGGAPSDQLTVTGNFVQDSAGTLAVGIDGGASSLLWVESSAALAGSLSVTNKNGFVPSPGEQFAVLLSGPSRTGTFALTGPDASAYSAVYGPQTVHLQAGSSAPAPPAITSPPVITGTSAAGQTLTCLHGAWSNDPTSYSYHWNRDGSAISGAVALTYQVQIADQGDQLTCTVIATGAGGASLPQTSAPVTVPSPSTRPAGSPVSPTSTVPGATPNPPADTIAPSISGTPTPGHSLVCARGTWSNTPTAYTYQWDRSGSLLAAATTSVYAVQIADEGAALTCAVTASNAAGTGVKSTSAATVVAQPGTLRCVKPYDQLSASSVGPFALGLSRAHARRTIRRFVVTHNNFDNFCLYGGWGIRVGYPTPKYLKTLSAQLRVRVSGRIVIALTANPYYALHGVRPGAKLSTVAHRLRLGKPFHIGSNDWYLPPSRAARGVLKVRRGVIQEIGLADGLINSNPAAQRRFMSSFNLAGT